MKPNLLRSLSLLVLVVPISLAFATDEIKSSKVKEESLKIGSMTLVGDTSAVYRDGRFQIFVPGNSKPSGFISIAAPSATTNQAGSEESDQSSNQQAKEVNKPKAGVAMATSVSMSASKSSSVAMTSMAAANGNGSSVLAEVPIADGKFSLTLELDEVRPVYFHVLDGISNTGTRMAPIKGQQFIIEPGELVLTMDARARSVVEGGKYNDAVFNSWKQSEEYVKTDQLYKALLKEPEGETDEARKAHADALRLQYEKILQLESDGRMHVALNDPDPFIRRLTLETTWLVMGDWVSKALEELKEMAPDDPWVAMRIEQDRKRKEMAAMRDRIAVGTSIVDFDAVDLEGSPVKLSEVQQGSKLVLLEFWASWCGPCRTEIPHMKKAYEKFKGMGFEIVSFTIDDSQEDWELASEEESLPWPNLGIGRESEAAKKYSVTGVPYNLLFDTSTGKIVDKNLRGFQLDEALSDYFL